MSNVFLDEDGMASVVDMVCDEDEPEWQAAWNSAKLEYNLDDYPSEEHKQFAAAAWDLELEVRNYSGRGYYKGPAVVMNDLGQDFVKLIRATICREIKWDGMGRSYVVYPD